MYRSSIYNPFDELFDLAYPTSNKAEVSTTDTGYKVSLLLPGFTKEEVEVKVEGSDLIIEAKTERKLPKFLSTHVKRTYVVEDIDSEGINGTLENGLLILEFTTAKKKSSKVVSLL